MRTNCIIKKLASYIILLALSLFASCLNESLIDNVPSTEKSIREGVPMVLNLSIENGSSITTRSTDYKWEDGATLLISGGIIFTEKGYYLYAVYKEDTGWRVYNLNGNEAEGQCDVYYSESLTYETVKAGIFDSGAYGGVYASTWYDRDRYAWIKEEESTCSYKDGIFYLNTTLVPLYGRVRFVADSPITAEYNHARVNLFPSEINVVNVSAAATDYLTFHKESDGKYYSNYIYSDAIPEIHIGDYVYKYRGNTLLERGASGCISLPTVPYTTATWTCEKYFEIVLDTEKTIELNGDGNGYFQQYTQLSSKNTGNEDTGGNEGRGNNIIRSSIGLNVEMEFTMHSRSGSTLSSYIESQNSFDRTARYYEGCAYHVIPTQIGVRQHFKIHNCYTSEGDWFCPYVRATPSYPGEAACVVKMTIHKTKLSNF